MEMFQAVRPMASLRAILPAASLRVTTSRTHSIQGGMNMRELSETEAKVVAGGASKNAGGGPGNSGPGDKNSQNERGHGGQPTG